MAFSCLPPCLPVCGRDFRKLPCGSCRHVPAAPCSCLLRSADHMLCAAGHVCDCRQSRANSAYEEYNRGFNKLK
jgi:hypothetical protein